MLELIQAAGLGLAVIFLGLLAGGLWRGSRIRRIPGQVSCPRVSVLVAARNEEKALPACLESLAAQDYPADRCEFIIIDDGSTDGTADLVRQRASRDSRFHLVSLQDAPLETIGPKKRALAAGLCQCHGEVVIVTDADCTVRPSWITCMAGCFSEGVGAVCGLIRYRQVSSFAARLAAFEGLVNSVMNSAVIGLGGALSCSGSNFAYRYDAFTNVGGFDPGGKSFSGDDDLLLQRFRRAGLKIRYCFDPQARIETEPPERWRTYWLRKRRHLSAGRKYAPPWIILAAAIYAGCLAVVLNGLLTLAGIQSESNFVIWWGLFSLSLLLVFNLGLRTMGEKGWWSWSVPAALLFPLFFVSVHPLTLLTSPAWKGRGGVSVKDKAAA